MSPSFVVNALVALLGVVAAAAVIGLVALWPEGEGVDRPEVLTGSRTHAAEVVAVAVARCRVPGQRDCRRVTVELTSGPAEGERATFTVGDATQARIGVGDDVRVYENRLPEGAVVAGTRLERYALADFDRRLPLAWLALGFAALVVAFGRWRGLRALLGLGVSLALVVVFVVPAILEGAPPTGVALVGALAIMLVTIPLAHGLGVKTVAASLGTATSLLLTLALASAFAELAHLTGLASDEAIFLRATAGDLSIRGLLLAGMVIGALGVLDDLTVSQASTVMALRRANPALAFGELFRGALAVGHDHVAATVNTLALAYAGASLPVLLVLSLGDVSFGEAAGNEAVAEEIVAMLVGSIGLIAAVPVTTALAAVLATRAARVDSAPAHTH